MHDDEAKAIHELRKTVATVGKHLDSKAALVVRHLNRIATVLERAYPGQDQRVPSRQVPFAGKPATEKQP